MRLPEFDQLLAADSFSGRADLFLCSHAHSDHLRGLRRSWGRGRIVATEPTARLLRGLYGVPEGCLAVLHVGASRRFDLGGGTVKITALPANHCPGSCMFLIEGAGKRVLWTGDFRLNPALRELAAALPPLDALYVDATYRGTGYRFPKAAEAVAEVVRIARAHRDGEILLGVYNLGKEPVVEAVADALKKRVYVPERRYRIYSILGREDLVTRDAKETNLRAFSRFYLESHARLGPGTIAIIPTGFSAEGRSRQSLYYVPYSEHCDAEEVEEFLRLVAARRVVEIA